MAMGIPLEEEWNEMPFGAMILEYAMLGPWGNSSAYRGY
jgi:hypothetical protein